LAEDDTEHLAPQFGKNLTIEIEATHIDDPDILEKRLATDIRAKIIKVDELRAIRGLPPLGPKQGGDLIVNQNSKEQSPLQEQEINDSTPPVLPAGKGIVNGAKLDSQYRFARHSIQ